MGWSAFLCSSGHFLPQYLHSPLVGSFNNGMCDHASKSVVRRGPGVCMTQETGLSFANIVLKLNVITCTVVLTVYVF